jgi:hypothetical protein
VSLATAAEWKRKLAAGGKPVLPLIDEILLLPPNPDYLAYLRARADQSVQIHTGPADR